MRCAMADRSVRLTILGRGEFRGAPMQADVLDRAQALGVVHGLVWAVPREPVSRLTQLVAVGRP